MKKLIFSSILLLSVYSTLLSQAVVEINLIVLNGLTGPESHELAIGIDPAATVAFDRGLDEYGPPPAPGGVSEFEAMLYLTPHTDSDRLTKDIRGPALSPFTGSFSYNLFARPSAENNAITLNINLPDGVSGGNISDLLNDTPVYPGENSIVLDVPPLTGSMLKITLNFDNIVSVSQIGNNLDIPDNFELFQNYPNPFNPVTTIKYSIPQQKNSNHVQGSDVNLRIYDILGGEIVTLINQYQDPGSYEITFNAARPSEWSVSVQIRSR